MGASEALENGCQASDADRKRVDRTALSKGIARNLDVAAMRSNEDETPARVVRRNFRAPYSARHDPCCCDLAGERRARVRVVDDEMRRPRDRM